MGLGVRGRINRLPRILVVCDDGRACAPGLVCDDVHATCIAPELLLEHQYASGLPDETCVAGVDADGDGLAGCDDPDCWWACHPACPYQATCP